jgi:hypothetical protein
MRRQTLGGEQRARAAGFGCGSAAAEADGTLFNSMRPLQTPCNRGRSARAAALARSRGGQSISGSADGGRQERVI